MNTTTKQDENELTVKGNTGKDTHFIDKLFEKVDSLHEKLREGDNMLVLLYSLSAVLLIPLIISMTYNLMKTMSIL